MITYEFHQDFCAFQEQCVGEFFIAQLNHRHAGIQELSDQFRECFDRIASVNECAKMGVLKIQAIRISRSKASFNGVKLIAYCL